MSANGHIGRTLQASPYVKFSRILFLNCFLVFLSLNFLTSFSFSPSQLKQQLEHHTSVPPSEQVLSGWPEALLVPKELEVTDSG